MARPKPAVEIRLLPPAMSASQTTTITLPSFIMLPPPVRLVPFLMLFPHIAGHHASFLIMLPLAIGWCLI